MPDDDLSLVVGSGRPLVMCGGYAMAPRTYHRTAALLARDCRVVVPDLLAIDGSWSYDAVIDRVLDTMDRYDVGRATLVAHSFGGAAALGVVCRQPDRVADLVLSDTLGVSTRWRLARSALSGLPHLWRLASYQAALDFSRSWLRHPLVLAQAAWWGFRSRRDAEIEQVARSGVPSTVLWATRDTLLSRDNGRSFARRLGGQFRLVGYPDGTPTDHDWVFRDSGLFVSTLRDLGVWATRR